MLEIKISYSSKALGRRIIHVVNSFNALHKWIYYMQNSDRKTLDISWNLNYRVKTFYTNKENERIMTFVNGVELTNLVRKLKKDEFKTLEIYEIDPGAINREIVKHLDFSEISKKTTKKRQ